VVEIPNQPPGIYALALWRGETTGTHALSGTAQTSFNLVEGGVTNLTLTVQ
jgi:hypothetical protein